MRGIVLRLSIDENNTPKALVSLDDYICIHFILITKTSITMYNIQLLKNGIAYFNVKSQMYNTNNSALLPI